MRALVVSNMLPDAGHPGRGRFVRDQVAALRRIGGAEVELYEFPPGARALAGAAAQLRRRYGPGAGRGDLDVVHAHFGLTAWPALAVPARVRALTVHGTDVAHPRTRLATAAALPLMDVVAAASASLAAQLPGRAARAKALVLPCGVDVERFAAIPRERARAQLGLDPDGSYLLFPADPARPEKRHDRAVALAERTGARLLSLGAVEPEEVPLWVNSADAVLVPSDREGFGLAALEALACDVPVLATPVGVHPDALDGVSGTLCARFDVEAWTQALKPHLADHDPRVQGRAQAERFSTDVFAAAVLETWSAALQRSG